MKYYLLFCIIAVSVSCQNNNKQDLSPNPIQLQDSLIKPGNPDLTSKIRTLKIRQEPYIKKIPTSGIVKAIPNNYAEIASPFSGRITRSFVSLGQYVNVGFSGF